MSLVSKEKSGQVLGSLYSVRSLAAIAGMGITALCSRFLESISLRTFYVVGGISIALASALIAKLPSDLGRTKERQPRLLIKKRYWLYYALIFFEGSRMQVFGTFGTLVLVKNYGLDVWQISLLLVASSIVNFLLTPRLGHLIDQLGERITLSTSYVALALCFVGYATFHNAWFLGALLISINLLVTLRMALTTYVNRIAPPGELAPTLSAGVSINHITSVSASLVAGALLEAVGYENLCWGAATIIMLSVPLALALRRPSPVLAQPELAGAK